MADHAEKVTLLNRKRGNLKGQLKRIVNNLADSLNDTELYVQLDVLCKLQERFERLKEDYYMIVKEEEFEETESTLSELDEEITKIEVRIKTSIRRIENSCAVNNQCSKDNNESSTVTSSHKLKLPEIPLPIFTGRCEDWNLFNDQFNNIITNNTELSDNDKLHYLRGALRGEAKTIEASEDSFQSLLKALQTRYDNRRLIVDSHIKNILTLPNIKHESSKDLRNFIDTITKNIRALKILEIEKDKFSDVLLLNIILEKLDRETRKQYELTLTSTDIPEFDSFMEFLERRYQILSNIQNNISLKQHSERSKSFFVKANDKPTHFCPACKTKTDHALYHCDKFKSLKLEDRVSLIRLNRRCYNCFNLHYLSQCEKKGSCRVCKKRSHHTLLHNYSSVVSTPVDHSAPLGNGFDTALAVSSPPPPLVPEEENVRVSLFSNGNNKTVLINTAIIYIRDSLNQKRSFRAILDSASESCFLTGRAADILGLKKERINIPIAGLSDAALNIKSKVRACLSNQEDDLRQDIEFLLVPKITDVMPSKRINISELNIPANIKLADPTFFTPQKIDVLLGAELFFDLLKADKIRLKDNLFLQDTYFGFLVSGCITENSNTLSKHCFLSKNLESLDKTLKSFWEIESLPDNKGLEVNKSDEAVFCEAHFVKTHSRDDSGRYVVEMPMVENAEHLLGESKELAENRLNAIWKRLDKNKTMAVLYKQFMTEYLNLSHMEEIKMDFNPKSVYYIPHHFVYRASNSSTPLRVVFDASAKTSSGQSLNSLQLNGGNIQPDLFSIIVCFRAHKYAISADIQKMYRQILIKSEQRDLQRIVWKDDINAPVKCFRLNTVTYGITSSSFLATRTLQALAEDDGKNFPLAAHALRNHTYMDDVLSSCATLPEAKELQRQLIQLLKCAGMKLHKWVSNSVDLLQSSSSAEEYSFQVSPELNSVKTLGIQWQPSTDYLTFKYRIQEREVYTKREVLSEIARLYDPLGFIGPVIAKAKIFMQQLWLLKIQWHDLLPPKESLEWRRFLQDLSHVNDIQIPRYMLAENSTQVQLLGFCDASKQGYGAVIYVRSRNEEGLHTSLLCSKSRVSPLKTVTIPRLELCSAVLLSKLMNKVKNILSLPIARIHLFSDSTIALAWIKTPPHQLKTFVSHRVAEIQALTTEEGQWKHVRSDQNPADVLSRGAYPSDLISNSLWWHGPESIQRDNSIVEIEERNPEYLKEIKEPTTHNFAAITNLDFMNSIWDMTNSYMKLIRVVSYIFRFQDNCRGPRTQGPLTSKELKRAEECLVKQVQLSAFETEIRALKGGSSVLPGSKLKFLNPFLDENSILRVGGRLMHADLDFDNKHQIILPKGHKFTKMIFEYFHKKYLHIGPQGLLYHVRMKFWPLSAKIVARKIVHDCVICFKTKPIAIEQIMGNLPSTRISPNYSFCHVGTDFCGPFEIRYKHQRKGIYQKIYVAIFVCLVTKAVHLELVTDLTSEAFIASLKRFFARRGKSSSITTDNATNFKGAHSEIKRLYEMVRKPDEILANYLTEESVEWHFIPPRSPNFGGLWEAGVKSFKYYLRRSLRNARLTYEEFQTLTVQIEGILNSRPLTPISAGINDMEVLTPGHFLIGRPINTIPEPQLIDIKETNLSRWQRITKFVQSIWKNWQKTYLSHLQNRSKWQFRKNNVKIGAMVILKDENLPPCRWALGRVVEVYPGSDGNIRVVKVKTATSEFKRAVGKICLLPEGH